MSEITTSSETPHTGLISEELSVHDVKTAKQPDSWRFAVRAGILVTSLVALTNLAVLIWASSLEVYDGSATVFEDSCAETKRITFWVDSAINILSTLLLGASNNCTQLLVAPTRKNIDDAHAAGRYLNVGVSSLRNVLAVSRWRQCLCVCLFLSSVPLHLLSSLEHQQSKNVLVVSDANVTGPLINIYYHFADGTYDLDWICSRTDGEKCITNLMLSHSTNWTITDFGTNLESKWFKASVQYCLAEKTEGHCTVKISTSILGAVLFCNIVKVACLACALVVRDFRPMATVGDLISSCLNDPDLYTYGKGPIAVKDVRSKDAVWIGSEICHNKLGFRLLNNYQEIFVKYPTSWFNHAQRETCNTTKDSPSTPDAVEKSSVPPLKWKKQNLRWYQASSASSWAVCIVLCTAAWSTGAYQLVRTMRVYEDISDSRYTLSRMWQDAVGTVSTNYLVGPDSHRLLTENVLLANTPQLAISFIYVFYNNCLTRMMLGQEY